MRFFSKRNWICGALMALFGFIAPGAQAFSLLGPFEPWMTITNGFEPGYDIGGPLSIGKGYRWNVPVVTYGFDASFTNYFGTNGVAAVESAISLVNALPPASQLNPANFPEDTTGYNYAAQSQDLYDLKSATLALLVEHLGLASPSRFAYTLKDFSITNGVVTGNVLSRSYDPVTGQPSSFVNGTQYTYDLIQFAPGWAEANTFTTSPQAPAFTAVADNVDWGGDIPLGSFAGAFYTGLTSDDIGGLAYLYSTNNVNYENLLPDVQGTGAIIVVNGALRPGVDKVTFAPQPVSVTGAFVAVTNLFTDTYITNGVAMQQRLARVTQQPDFLFTATDLVSSSYLYDRTGTTNWANNAALNGQISGAGPGVIQPPVNFSFNKLGQSWENAGGNEDAATQNPPLVWGTFDGSPNPPIPYPQAGAAPLSSPVRVTIGLTPPGSKPTAANFRWVLNSGIAGYNFQTSTNPSNWTTLFAITNNGSANYYVDEQPASSQRYFRVVPQ